MRTTWILSLVVSPLLVLGSPPGNTIREGGIKIGTGRGTVPKGVNVGRGNSAVRIGEGGRLSNSTRQRSFPTTTTTTTTPTRFTPQSSVGNNFNITDLKVRTFVQIRFAKKKKKNIKSVKEPFHQNQICFERNILYLLYKKLKV